MAFGKFEEARGHPAVHFEPSDLVRGFVPLGRDFGPCAGFIADVASALLLAGGVGDFDKVVGSDFADDHGAGGGEGAQVEDAVGAFCAQMRSR